MQQRLQWIGMEIVVDVLEERQTSLSTCVLTVQGKGSCVLCVDFLH